MQLTCCSPSPLWTVRRKLSSIHVMATQAFFLSSLSYIKIQRVFWLYSAVEFTLVLKKTLPEGHHGLGEYSTEISEQEYVNSIFGLCCLLLGQDPMVNTIHSWADVAQLLLRICGLKKLLVQWQGHGGFALHGCLPLLEVAC